jgi:hypothetical protein
MPTPTQAQYDRLVDLLDQLLAVIKALPAPTAVRGWESPDGSALDPTDPKTIAHNFERALDSSAYMTTGSDADFGEPPCPPICNVAPSTTLALGSDPQEQYDRLLDVARSLIRVLGGSISTERAVARAAPDKIARDYERVRKSDRYMITGDRSDFAGKPPCPPICN